MSVTNKIVAWDVIWKRCLCAVGLLLATTSAWTAPAVAPTPVVKHPITGPVANNGPTWNALKPSQQQALAPLAGEWNTMEGARKQKWLQIAARFSMMKPDDQLRTQERMREWVKLTPEQRRTVRENYARAKKLNSSQKTAEWKQYQQLSAEQKKKLATSVPSKRSVTNLPSRDNAKTIVAPIKSMPKHVLEQSVTPHAPHHKSHPSVAPIPSPVPLPTSSPIPASSILPPSSTPTSADQH